MAAILRSVLFFALFLHSSTLPIIFSQAHLQHSNLTKLKSLEGSRKGQTIPGLSQLKNYLTKLGYLTSNQHINRQNNDLFDDPLESALISYQQNHHLKPIGTLNKDTIKTLSQPRCAVPDSINPHYRYFPGTPRWPALKSLLRYAFVPPYKVNEDIMRSAFSHAFESWANVTNFVFVEIKEPAMADLKIRFGTTHNGVPFDGPDGFLAFANAPTGGESFFDESETWTIGVSPNGHNLETVARHEIGHLLGMGHTTVPEAVMFPVISKGVMKDLNEDDVQGIRALYGL